MSMLKNGINMTNLGAYVDSVKSDPSQGQVKFVARSSWGGGTNTNVEVSQFYADGKPVAPQGRSFSFSVSEPGALGGADTAPNPGEMIAAALCGCLTAGIATNAALFDTALEDIEVAVEVEWDMLGILGLDRSVPSRAKGIHYTVGHSENSARGRSSDHRCGYPRNGERVFCGLGSPRPAEACALWRTKDRVFGAGIGQIPCTLTEEYGGGHGGRGRL
jgi:organic hydroperoxide reductase OsmC/OhrA